MDAPPQGRTTSKNSGRTAGFWGREAIALGIALAVSPLSFAQAQQGDAARPSALGAVTIPGKQPRLEVPGMVIGAPASETTLGIALGRTVPPPANSYIRIRGLGPRMSLSEGHMIAPGAWAVPLVALPDLRVVVPAGVSGRTDVSVALVTVDGGVVAEAKTSLIVAPAALPQPKASRPADGGLAAQRTPGPVTTAREAPAQSPPQANPKVAALPPTKTPDATAAPLPPARDMPQVAPMTPEARERSLGFLARGRKLLNEGNIASARLFFRRAADEGLADAALALGTTFDPAELDRLRAVGIKPDTAEARRWYERARELGAGPAADRRLKRLGSR